VTQVQTGKHAWKFLAEIRLIFPFLFDRFEFSSRKVVQDADGEHCLVIVGSSACQIKFRLDMGAPEYFLGTLSAPPVWEDAPEWEEGDPIVAYLARVHPNVPVPPWPTEKRERSTEEIMQIYSRRLQPFAGEIISAFAQNLEVDWWKDFRKELTERIQKIKDQIARGERVILR
jgi:hypothetical protein